MNKIFILLILLTSTLLAGDNFDSFCEAIKHKEQGPGESNNKYEIGYLYFLDARKQLRKDGLISSLEYKDLKGSEFLCKLCIRAYMRKYAPKMLIGKQWTYMARLHNGGPKVNKKHKTKEYAECIINLMTLYP